MIEVVYKEEKKEAVGNEGFFHIPRNIRQIGEISPAHKIYMEDYAHTFLVRIAQQCPNAQIGLLLGQSNWAAGITYIFIRSVFQIQGMEVTPEHIAFTDEIWQQAEEKIQEYFPEQEVVGWFFIMPECALELTDVLYRTHLSYFGGNDKLLYMMEPVEKEEAFFQYENGCMGRQKGFYLYYDKNKPMQEYMIEMNKNIPIESKDVVKDKAVQDFRKIISGKPPREEGTNGGFSLLHAVGACVVIGAIVVGLTYVDDHGKLEETSARVSRTEKTQLSDGQAKTTIPAQTALEDEPVQERPADGTEGKEEEQEEKIQETGTPMPTAAPETEAAEPQIADAQTEDPGTAEAQEGQARDALSQENTLTVNGSYVVQNGDTLSKISKRVYGNTSQVRNICKLNDLDISDIIYPGQIILLP